MASSSSSSQNRENSALPGASSASAASASKYFYDVYINHYGSDVKKTLASHLYRRLHLHGLRTFLDNAEMQLGENINSQVKDAIATASVNVAIFTPRYAESCWCLNELLLMLDSRSPIVPVFYNVKPFDLRWTEGKDGVYARALQNLQKKKTKDLETGEDVPQYDSNTIESWRNALSRVGEISGFELEAYNGDEAELLDGIVEEVFKLARRSSASTLVNYPIGLSKKVKEFLHTVLSQQQSEKLQVVGIVGLDGVGKTTLAKELFKMKRSSFSKSCILYDVRTSSLHSLLSKLLKGLTQLDLVGESVDEAIDLFKKHLSSFQSLVILDNVDHWDQLDTLLSVLTVLPLNSLILITSLHKHVLRRSGIDDSSIYELTRLNTQDSREVFCFHAFSQPSPLPGFEDLVEEFLTACNGLPLSLKVVGALLCGKTDRSYWQGQLYRFQRSPRDIKETLKISYDALTIEEQQIFLHIACCCIGEKRDLAIRLWDGSGCRGLLGFESLQKRCLVEVDGDDCIIMHEHLKDLGRSIADETGLRRPLWPLTENNPHLLQRSSIEQVITELRRNIDDLLQQSFVIREIRGFVILILVMMIILAIMMIATMIWRIGVKIILITMIAAIMIWKMG